MISPTHNRVDLKLRQLTTTAKLILVLGNMHAAGDPDFFVLTPVVLLLLLQHDGSSPLLWWLSEFLYFATIPLLQITQFCRNLNLQRLHLRIVLFSVDLPKLR